MPGKSFVLVRSNPPWDTRHRLYRKRFAGWAGFMCALARARKKGMTYALFFTRLSLSLSRVLPALFTSLHQQRRKRFSFLFSLRPVVKKFVCRFIYIYIYAVWKIGVFWRIDVRLFAQKSFQKNILCIYSAKERANNGWRRYNAILMAKH